MRPRCFSTIPLLTQSPRPEAHFKRGGSPSPGGLIPPQLIRIGYRSTPRWQTQTYSPPYDLTKVQFPSKLSPLMPSLAEFSNAYHLLRLPYGCMVFVPLLAHSEVASALTTGSSTTQMNALLWSRNRLTRITAVVTHYIAFDHTEHGRYT